MKDRDFPGQLAVSLQPQHLPGFDQAGQVWLGVPDPSSDSYVSRELWGSKEKAKAAAAQKEETSIPAWDVIAGAERRAFAEERQEQHAPEPIEEHAAETEEPTGVIQRFEKLIERVFRRQAPAQKK